MIRRRIVLAALVSPLVIPLLYFMAMAFLSGYTEQSSGHMHKLVDFTTHGMLLLSYLASFALGIPLVLVLANTEKLTLWNCVWTSSVIGVIAMFIVFSDPFLSLIGALPAFFVAVVFCAIAGIRGPKIRGQR